MRGEWSTSSKRERVVVEKKDPTTPHKSTQREQRLEDVKFQIAKRSIAKRRYRTDVRA